MPTIVTTALPAACSLPSPLAPLFPIGDVPTTIHDDLNWFGKFLDVGWHFNFADGGPSSHHRLAGLQRIHPGATAGRNPAVTTSDRFGPRTARKPGDSTVLALRNAVNPLITSAGFLNLPACWVARSSPKPTSTGRAWGQIDSGSGDGPGPCTW